MAAAVQKQYAAECISSVLGEDEVMVV